MLNQLERLCFETDGRYATDAELEFLSVYCNSFNLRIQTYLKLQELEPLLVQQAFQKLRSIDPAIFHYNRVDASAKWKQDTIRVLRHVAVAVLLDDPGSLQEQFLIWFQTIMKAFGTQKSCDLTYQVLQEVVKYNLTARQAGLVCPVLELTRLVLGDRSRVRA